MLVCAAAVGAKPIPDTDRRTSKDMHMPQCFHTSTRLFATSAIFFIVISLPSLIFALLNFFLLQDSDQLYSASAMPIAENQYGLEIKLKLQENF